MTRHAKYAAFVAHWQQAPTLADAATAAGMSSADARFLAGHLRRKGVPLKRFRSGGKPGADYEALARLALEGRP